MLSSGAKNGCLAGKHALITGGSSGIGLATASAFIRENARVTIVGRNKERLENAQRELGESARCIVADLSREAGAIAVAEEVRCSGKCIDILVANAGGFLSIAINYAATYDKATLSIKCLRELDVLCG
jgi:short-subunit dehydrogenase